MALPDEVVDWASFASCSRKRGSRSGCFRLTFWIPTFVGMTAEGENRQPLTVALLTCIIATPVPPRLIEQLPATVVNTGYDEPIIANEVEPGGMHNDNSK